MAASGIVADQRRYLVEYRVRSSLRSHRAQPFTFRFANSDVTLSPPDSGGSGGEFTASVALVGEVILLAEREAHEALTAVLDLVSFQMKTAALITDPVRTHVEGSGEIRQCVVYESERREVPIFMMPANAEEVRRLLTAALPSEVTNALYWLRWSYVADTAPEAFFFTWMAVEQLAGPEHIASKCSHCQAPLICPTDTTHGPHTRSTVTTKQIKALLDRHGVIVSPKWLRIRHSLVHGGLAYTFEKRVALGQMLPLLRTAVEEELHQRLGATEALQLKLPGRGSVTRIVQYPCEYKTAFPSEPFPSDAPTLRDVVDYKENIRRGRAHPKIITFPEGAPRW